MSGLGFKTWVPGDVLSAVDVNGYLMRQAVAVFTNSAARSSAIPSPTPGQMSYLTSTDAFERYTSGSAWAPVSNPGDITAVTAGTALTGGGDAGDLTLNVDLAAVGSAVLASPDITGSATIAAGTVTGNLAVNGTATLAATTSIGDVSATEIGYLDGVTSAIQTQLNSKAPTADPTFTGVVSGNASGTAAAADAAKSIGFKGIPGSGAGASGAYTLVASDSGELVYTTTSRTVTIPANSSVPFEIGTSIVFISGAGATTTIAITSDTLTLAGTGATGSRTLAAHGMATAVKVGATTWYISGNGLS